MSLNKFNSTEIKPYLKIGCSQLNTGELKVNGLPISSSNASFCYTQINSPNGNIAFETSNYWVVNDRMILTSFCKFSHTSSTNNLLTFNITIPEGYILDISYTFFCILGQLSGGVYTGVGLVKPFVAIQATPTTNRIIQILFNNFDTTTLQTGVFYNLSYQVTFPVFKQI